MSRKTFYSVRAASGGHEDLSCGYESGEILAGDSDVDSYSAESEGDYDMHDKSSEGYESSDGDISEPEMTFSHQNKKSRVSTSDEITPSRSVLPKGRRVLAPTSDPTHKKTKPKKGHRILSVESRARSTNSSPSDQRQPTEVTAVLTEISNTLSKVVARLDAQEKVLKKITSSSTSSSSNESQKTEVPLIVRVSKKDLRS